MAKFEINGRTKISGEIQVAGNKNSVLPIMTAALLAREPCIIENIPHISDVATMTKLLEISGAKVSRTFSSKLLINAQTLKNGRFPSELTEKLRASVLLLAPVLTRMGHIQMGYPGGDIIGRRPLGAHFQVLEALGAKIETEDGSITASCAGFKGAEIFMEEASVTATENAIIAATLASGETVIKRAASEPHVVDLCQFLIKMGADISGVGTNILRIKGVDQLFGTTHQVRPDHIEAGTFTILAAVTSGTLRISPVIREDMDMILLTLSKFGVNYKLENDTLIVSNGKLKAVEKVTTDIWPGFPTDLMAPMIVLATQAEGVTLLHDWMYESRMFFVDKLLSMGAKVEIADPHRVLVYGPTKLRGQRLDTPDIRAGSALVIAALAAGGQSLIEKAELIERGYENIVQRLSRVGAKVKRVD